MTRARVGVESTAGVVESAAGEHSNLSSSGVTKNVRQKRWQFALRRAESARRLVTERAKQRRTFDDLVN
jgi:hypothetical protein